MRLNQVQKLLLGVTTGVGNVVAAAVGLQVDLQPIHVRLATRPVLVSCTVLVVGCLLLLLLRSLLPPPLAA
jgi:hypothetical protein